MNKVTKDEAKQMMSVIDRLNSDNLRQLKNIIDNKITMLDLCDDFFPCTICGEMNCECGENE